MADQEERIEEQTDTDDTDDVEAHRRRLTDDEQAADDGEDFELHRRR
jgi:hypothetical protein